MISNLSLLLKKYSVPALFTILGLIMVIMGVSSEQNTAYTLATLMMFVAGAMSFFYSSGRLSSKVLWILGAVAGVIALVTLYKSYDSVSKTAEHIKRYELCVEKSQLNLRDIRTAQKAFAEQNGRYAKTWDELATFIKTGKVPFVVSEGIIPSRKITEAERNFIYKDNRAIDNNMTEEEAYVLSKSAICPEDLTGFKRDTIQVSFMSTKFDSKSYKMSRMKAGLGKFYVDSLAFIPMSGGKKWKLETVDSLKIGEDVFPAIRVSGKLPFARIQGEKPEEISFGKLTTNDTGGSWEQ